MVDPVQPQDYLMRILVHSKVQLLLTNETSHHGESFMANALQLPSTREYDLMPWRMNVVVAKADDFHKMSLV